MLILHTCWKGIKNAGEMVSLIAGLFFVLFLCFLLGFSDWPETQHDLSEF